MAQAHKPTSLLDIDECAQLICDSKIEDKLDLGAVLLYKLEHPEHGLIFVVNSAVGHSGVMSA